MTPQVLAIAKFIEAVGPDALVLPAAKPRRDSGARYCACGRRISANKIECLACAENT